MWVSKRRINTHGYQIHWESELDKNKLKKTDRPKFRTPLGVTAVNELLSSNQKHRSAM